MRQTIPILIIAALLSCLHDVKAQYTVVVPPSVNIIRNDTIIDCSFIPSHQFLVCPGASLGLTGNSTCANKFYMENASVVTFNDTVPSIPYGLFSFFIRGIAILDYNDNTNVSFGFIDTLVFEPSALLVDTGSNFHFIQSTAVVFDYSLFPTSNPCGTSGITDNGFMAFSVYPVPFKDEISFRQVNRECGVTIRMLDMTGREMERFETEKSPLQKFRMQNEWSGAAFLQVIRDGVIAGGKHIFRLSENHGR